MTEATTDRARKSVKLTPEQYKAFAKWVSNQPTKVDAAIIIGISRTALDRILIVKSGSQESVDKILKVLAQDAGTA
jgi:hypothetical protein